MSDSRTKQLREESGNVVYSDALTSFLYELMRDHLTVGKVELLVRAAINEPGEIVFTNGWLAQYANNLAHELVSAKTNNLVKNLSKVFGDGNSNAPSDNRPSFSMGEKSKSPDENAVDNKKIIDDLVGSGQLSRSDADEIKKEIEEFEREYNKPMALVSDPEIKFNNEQ